MTSVVKTVGHIAVFGLAAFLYALAATGNWYFDEAYQLWSGLQPIIILGGLFVLPYGVRAVYQSLK